MRVALLMLSETVSEIRQPSLLPRHVAHVGRNPAISPDPMELESRAVEDLYPSRRARYHATHALKHPPELSLFARGVYCTIWSR